MPGNHNEIEKRLWAAADQLWANTGLKPSKAPSVNGKTSLQAMSGFRNNAHASRAASEVTLGHKPVATFIHPGTHRFPAAAPATIVKFFKEHAKL